MYGCSGTSAPPRNRRHGTAGTPCRGLRRAAPARHAGRLGRWEGGRGDTGPPPGAWCRVPYPGRTHAGSQGERRCSGCGAAACASTCFPPPTPNPSRVRAGSHPCLSVGPPRFAGRSPERLQRAPDPCVSTDPARSSPAGPDSDGFVGRSPAVNSVPRAVCVCILIYIYVYSGRGI